MQSRFSDRHQQVLKTAMQLVAERGLSNASLRELARRVGLSQPSLYHYFESKDALVAQIIELRAETAIGSAQVPDKLPGLVGFLRMVSAHLFRVYDDPEHAVFVRFMFAVTMEKPELGNLLRQVFLEKAKHVARPMLDHYVEQGDVASQDAELMFRMFANALVFHLIESRVLHSVESSTADDAQLADFVIDIVSRGVISRRRGGEP